MACDYAYKINWCGTHNCSPDWRWDIAGFKDYDLWAVFRGKGSIAVDGELFEIREGSCFLLPPNKRIYAEHDPNSPLLVINVHFDFVEQHRPVFPFALEHRFISNPAFFKELLTRVLSCHYSARPQDCAIWLSAAIKEFFTSPKLYENTQAPNMNARCVQEICQSINEDVACACSLSAFAERYGYSTTYLGKVFHKVTGTTFSQYILNARISQAKLLLRTSDMPISQIAEALGYYDACHFIRQFKAEVGISPRSYRK